MEKNTIFVKWILKIVERKMTTILYVEDNEDNIYMLSKRLKKKGFDITIAKDGEEGLKSARDLKPDLILMDLSLPLLDGWRQLEY